MVGNTKKVSVLLDETEYGRFENYCKQQGFKKSTLTARLIRDHLVRETVAQQPIASYAVPSTKLLTSKQKKRRQARDSTQSKK